ncbi:uncharacterized protein BP01DRAFT_423950 [Aspergillus saccharolyticus JOP 1030-1]|uniref:Uncharacterized protein n=1 Tax=Aspergillus saccharolyticus JOP 1030-1 TaxID=1450539 RepID=A0A318ZBC3_9EURO|nr:hypothetical protein BP01DRAFT_423950 [Aspergillus saccharolyticus JOP 1030-1]PYH44745.1 hypothetical protein BP01DRAFT_423950 [Aspergillus saccharolyticus JOP 1030-1]
MLTSCLIIFIMSSTAIPVSNPERISGLPRNAALFRKLARPLREFYDTIYVPGFWKAMLHVCDFTKLEDFVQQLELSAMNKEAFEVKIDTVNKIFRDLEISFVGGLSRASAERLAMWI